MSVNRDAKYIPKEENAALYIRPTMISTETSLRIGPPRSAKLFILLSPVKSYFHSTKHGVSLLVDRRFLRAWPKGTGSLKLACNYAPTVLPLQFAHRKKCVQNLCLGPNDEITEAGSMNIFFVLHFRDREKYVITPPADDLVLPGVVRSSVLSLLKKSNVKVIVEPISLQKILKGISDRHIVECFGCGTACSITPIHMIQCDGKKYRIPKAQDPISCKLFTQLREIQYGERKSRWTVPV
mmetsp:Transcript_23450/g.36578  ORF Transcript_23450/g.36578 Transcript_23450/m.36578 type:complete len:239 (-) Transcript_23450:30-746(-)